MLSRLQDSNVNDNFLLRASSKSPMTRNLLHGLSDVDLDSCENRRGLYDPARECGPHGNWTCLSILAGDGVTKPFENSSLMGVRRRYRTREDQVNWPQSLPRRRRHAPVLILL
jgi:hypothetical protein